MIRRPLRPTFSYSARHELLRALGDARELALQCAHAEHYDSELRKKCEVLHSAVDALATELTGDPAYFHLKVAPSNNAG